MSKQISFQASEIVPSQPATALEEYRYTYVCRPPKSKAKVLAKILASDAIRAVKAAKPGVVLALEILLSFPLSPLIVIAWFLTPEGENGWLEHQRLVLGVPGGLARGVWNGFKWVGKQVRIYLASVKSRLDEEVNKTS